MTVLSRPWGLKGGGGDVEMDETMAGGVGGGGGGRGVWLVALGGAYSECRNGRCSIARPPLVRKEGIPRPGWRTWEVVS